MFKLNLNLGYLYDNPWYMFNGNERILKITLEGLPI